ncbi:hypothetical protein [Propionivibrio dicarboxylicus]|uniref:Sigma 54 modulation protein / S30EA ribosomal protein n=1 Tax=Propionivibrio dicarboxylicus TaxID=83767 RepID=A0A1G7XXX4_9RHOO|nr:hypothetical protein [Propionivibrio dicarboxylicus]SDG88570.1 hypothetical protein SAMN05660652_00822 [Propionivibrio dicarboxylicus]
MNISVKAQGSALASRCRRFAVQATLVQVGQFSRAVEHVRVQLDDLSQSSRSGVSQLCRIVLHFRDHSFVVVEGVGESMNTAIERATLRISERLRLHPLLLVSADTAMTAGSA